MTDLKKEAELLHAWLDQWDVENYPEKKKECVKRIHQALIKVRNEAILECAEIAEDVYNLPTGKIIKTTECPTNIGFFISEAIKSTTQPEAE